MRASSIFSTLLRLRPRSRFSLPNPSSATTFSLHLSPLPQPTTLPPFPFPMSTDTHTSPSPTHNPHALSSALPPEPELPQSPSNNNNNLRDDASPDSALSPTVEDSMSDSGDHGRGAVVEFSISRTCSLKIQMGDITRWSIDTQSDAIVNAANERMLGGGGVDGAIHRAAGPELREACFKVPEVEPYVRCPTGEARITPGFRLPASHVIHTVGPIYDEDENPEELLKSAYRNSMTVAKENNIQYVAFPAISCGIYGYPYDEAASVSISTIKEFANDVKEVHFVLFSEDLYDIWLEKAKEITRSEGSIQLEKAEETAGGEGSVQLEKPEEEAGSGGSVLDKPEEVAGSGGSVQEQAEGTAGGEGSVSST